MEPRINKITIEKIDNYSQPTWGDPFRVLYTVYLDNDEKHTAITPKHPTVSEASVILGKLLKTCITGSVNERKVQEW